MRDAIQPVTCSDFYSILCVLTTLENNTTSRIALVQASQNPAMALGGGAVREG